MRSTTGVLPKSHAPTAIQTNFSTNAFSHRKGIARSRARSTTALWSIISSTWMRAASHVDEIILHKAVVERAPDRAIPFRCEKAFVEKLVWMALGACDLGHAPVVERIVRTPAQHHEEPVFVTNIMLPKGFLPGERMQRPHESFSFPTG